MYGRTYDAVEEYGRIAQRKWFREKVPKGKSGKWSWEEEKKEEEKDEEEEKEEEKDKEKEEEEEMEEKEEEKDEKQ